jgi:hypothetical protein
MFASIATSIILKKGSNDSSFSREEYLKFRRNALKIKNKNLDHFEILKLSIRFLIDFFD